MPYDMDEEKYIYVVCRNTDRGRFVDAAGTDESAARRYAQIQAEGYQSLYNYTLIEEKEIEYTPATEVIHIWRLQKGESFNTVELHKYPDYFNI